MGGGTLTLEHIAPPLFGALHIFYYLNVRNFLSIYICKKNGHASISHFACVARCTN